MKRFSKLLFKFIVCGIFLSFILLTLTYLLICSASFTIGRIYWTSLMKLWKKPVKKRQRNGRLRVICLQMSEYVYNTFYFKNDYIQYIYSLDINFIENKTKLASLMKKIIFLVKQMYADLHVSHYYRQILDYFYRQLDPFNVYCIYMYM